jgi:hypothetical protein
MRFVEYENSHEAMYLRFASKVGGTSRGKPFSYYGASDAIVVRRHILINDGAVPPVVIGAVTQNPIRPARRSIASLSAGASPTPNCLPSSRTRSSHHAS